MQIHIIGTMQVTDSLHDKHEQLSYWKKKESAPRSTNQRRINTYIDPQNSELQENMQNT